MSLFRKKPIPTERDSELIASLGRWPLLFLGVGTIIGSGIFVILGYAIPLAGPAVLLSFVFAGLVALISALAFAELSSAIPASGSSYSYAYMAFGELVAWAVAWMLILEYGVALAATAVGWGAYLDAFLSATLDLHLPDKWAHPPAEGGILNLPAIFIVVAVASFLLRGTSESTSINTIIVLLKLSILIFFAVVALTTFDANNLSPFMPLGIAGVFAGAGQVFFSYLGFDAVATAGEEAKNPQRDLPFAIIGCLGIVTLIYIIVALAAIGAHGWIFDPHEDTEVLLATIAADAVGEWANSVIALGAVIAIFSVLLAGMFAQSRILYAVSNDGLLPKTFSVLNPRTKVPSRGIILSTLVIAVLAALLPVAQLAQAVSIGTLGIFLVVNIGVISLRRTHPDLKRSFRVPWVPLLPIIGVGLIFTLASGLHRTTWIAFLIWMTVGAVVYFAYSRRRSKLAL